VGTRAAARAGQLDERNEGKPPGKKESAWDVKDRTKEGYNKQIEELGMGPNASAAEKEVARWGKGVTDAASGMEKAFENGLDGIHVGSLKGIKDTAKQQWNQLGKDLDSIKKAKGALQTVGAVFGLITSLEQLVSAPFAAIPFAALPALRILDMDIGLPHAHKHWPNMPPAPPIPLPSTGPVIPIPYVSGANKVTINGMPAARCGDMGLGIWCGGFVPMYEIFLGSASVWIEGARAARTAVDITKHCIFSKKSKAEDKPIGPFLGITIMGSGNVLIGGCPMPSLTAMAMAAAFKALFKFAGKVGGALAKTKHGAAVAAKLKAASTAVKDFIQTARQKAIRKSGIVGEHAEAISHVAKTNDQVLIFQNVNGEAKGLIAEGAATKNMDIKGKSDLNGMIPLDQSKSPKAAAMGDEFVNANSKKLEELAKGPEYTKVKGPDGNDVLAKFDKDGKPVPVTSDYDLLAVGDKKPRGPVNPDTPGGKGATTATEAKTIDDLNRAIDHPGGNTVHHGPENNYKGQGPPKDGPKYPVTAFEPDGSVKSINNDADLKNYFNEQNKKGYGLEPEESWGWKKGPDGNYI
jgi:uncharacterized Zn-binding protein involved in type VI secretion